MTSPSSPPPTVVGYPDRKSPNPPFARTRGLDGGEVAHEGHHVAEVCREEGPQPGDEEVRPFLLELEEHIPHDREAQAQLHRPRVPTLRRPRTQAGL
jgi:hypothetical protein